MRIMLQILLFGHGNAVSLLLQSYFKLVLRTHFAAIAAIGRVGKILLKPYLFSFTG